MSALWSTLSGLLWKEVNGAKQERRWIYALKDSCVGEVIIEFAFGWVWSFWSVRPKLEIYPVLYNEGFGKEILGAIEMYLLTLLVPSFCFWLANCDWMKNKKGWFNVWEAFRCLKSIVLALHGDDVLSGIALLGFPRRICRARKESTSWFCDEHLISLHVFLYVIPVSKFKYAFSFLFRTFLIRSYFCLLFQEHDIYYVIKHVPYVWQSRNLSHVVL